MKVKFRRVIYIDHVIHREDSRITAVYREEEMIVTPTIGMAITFGDAVFHVSHVTYDTKRGLLLATEGRTCYHKHDFDPIVEGWKKEGWKVEVELKGEDAFYNSRYHNLCVRDDIDWEKLKR